MSLSRRDLLRGVAGIGAAAGGSALLPGCVGGRKPGTLLYGFYGNQQEIDIYRRVAELYRKRNPHVKMTYTFADPGGFFQKLPLLFRSGSAPDVFMAAESWVSGLSSLGGYADLSADMRRDGLSESTWLPGAINAGKVGKKILALPVVVYPKGIAYNETLFKKNHVPLPTASWTQADFLSAARAVQAGSGSQGAWGMNNSFGTTQPYDLVTLYGGMIFDFLTRKMTATSPDVVRAVRFVGDLITKYRVTPNAAENQALLAGFPTGSFGMDIFAGYDTQSWTEEIGGKFAWNIAPYPVEWRGTYQNNNVAIFDGTPNRAAAWDLAKFIATDPEAQKIQGEFATPALTSTARRWVETLPEEYRRLHWQPLIDRLNQQGVAYQGGEFNKVWDLMGQKVQAVEDQGASVGAAMDVVQRRGAAILSTQQG